MTANRSVLRTLEAYPTPPRKLIFEAKFRRFPGEDRCRLMTSGGVEHRLGETNAPTHP